MNYQAARILFAVTLLSLSPALVVAQSNKTDKAFVKQPLAHTYSIVARDPETGQLGVAAQSHWFSVGAMRRDGLLARRHAGQREQGRRGVAPLQTGLRGGRRLGHARPAPAEIEAAARRPENYSADFVGGAGAEPLTLLGRR
jgi:Family of unknown function (DUF1028)